MCHVSVLDSRSQEIIEVQLPLFSTVSELKQICQNGISIPVKCQELLFRGKVISGRRCLMDLVERQLKPAPNSSGHLQSSLTPSECFARSPWQFDFDSSDGPPRRCNHRTRRAKYQKPQKLAPKSHENSLHFVLRISQNKRREFGRLLPMQKLPSKKCKNVVKRITLGMNRRLNPQPVSGGLSGSYFLLDRFRNREVIFKPRHEEPFAPLNPKGFRDSLGTELHPSGIDSGQLYLREAAAYLMDQHGLFGVPETFLAVVKHPFFENAHERRDLMGISHFIPEDPKSDRLSIETIEEHSNDRFNILNLKVTDRATRVGSVQKFVPNCTRLESISTSKLSAFEIQKIALLDMRLLNATRTESDVLVKRHKGAIKLVPINHGMSLGRRLQIERDAMFWADLPQIRLPLDPRLARFVQKLRPRETAQKLSKRLGLAAKTVNLVRKAETFIKHCVRRKMTIYEMTQLFYRNGQDKAPLEKTIESVDFMSKDFKARDKWFLRNRILVKSKKFSNKKLDERISRIRKNSEEDELAPIASSGQSAHIKLNSVAQSSQKNQKSTKKNEKYIIACELEESDLQSPLTFLSKKKSEIKNPVVTPFFNESNQMKSLNTFSTENPNSPFAKNEEFKLISFGSLDIEDPQPAPADADRLQEGHFRRRRINSEVIQTSLDKHRPHPAANKKSAFFGLNDVPFQKLFSAKDSSQVLFQSKADLAGQAQRAPDSRKSGQSSRSLSVFQIRSKQKEQVSSDFLDDFRQDDARDKLGSFADLGRNDPFRLRTETPLPRKNLRLHYFKCCMEQLLDGWSLRRPIASAKRKYTAPVLK